MLPMGSFCSKSSLIFRSLALVLGCGDFARRSVIFSPALDFLRRGPEELVLLVIVSSPGISFLVIDFFLRTVVSSPGMSFLVIDFFLRTDEEGLSLLEVQESLKVQWLFSGDRTRTAGISLSRLGSERHDSFPEDFMFLRRPDFSCFLDVYTFNSSGEKAACFPVCWGLVVRVGALAGPAPQEALADPLTPEDSIRLLLLRGRSRVFLAF